MARIRTQNEIILSLLDFYRISQPELDTKPGTVARDLLVDGFAVQLSRLYEELSRVSALQSLRLAIGSDLDKLAANFGATRKRGSKSGGPALLTFNELVSDISIGKGEIITARNGATFIVVNSVVVSPAFANNYRATASQYRADLDFANITDQYAVEVLLESTATGIQGNISKYSLAFTNIAGINNVINIVPFGGGKQAEDDAAFKSRILSIFSGANTGTALGYRNAALEDPAVLDAIVIEPGNPLMIRDGTQISTSESGEKTIISEGTGGKVDIYIYGSRLQEIIDTFIYKDKSNTGSPTHPANDYVLGQISGDENKTIIRKRLDNLSSGILPTQPINNVVEITGTSSGSNFVEKSVDGLGRVSGNFEIIPDTGVYGGSPWGFDKIRWISDRISDLQEDKTKGIFNGQDSLAFTDILEINRVEQNISVVNENSRVLQSDRSIIQLSHFPITNVTRVFNVSTGERYVVVNQNPDGNSSINTTGKIKITGSSLPAVSDILQVDYTWVLSYDPNFDFDNKLNSDNPRTVGDSIDWGYSNIVRREQATLISEGSGLSLTTTHDISSIISVNVFESENSSVVLTSGRKSIVVSSAVSNVISIIKISDNSELWKTSTSNGSFSGFTIFLPTDTAAEIDDDVLVVYNAEDVFNVSDNQGSFNSNKITIVPSSTATAGALVEVNYIADINTILPATLLSNLPAIKSENTFNTINETDIGNQPCTNIFSSGEIVQNLRQSPCKLALNIAGAISPGVITITGTTIVGVFDAVFNVGSEGLKQDLRAALRKHLGLSSVSSIPSNLKLARLISMEKVEATSNLEVLNVLHKFDIKGYALKENTYVKNESIFDSNLTSYEVKLPNTISNEANKPSVGDVIRTTFYYILESSSENVLFSKSGTLYSNKTFANIDSIAISSGFSSGASSSATLTITSLNQPLNGSRYRAIYDYTAPKENERITVRYNYNKLISDVVFNIEDVRPINADVLPKEGRRVLIDVELKIVVLPEFINNSSIVQQNVQDAITAALNASSLGTTIDSSDLISIANSIDGVDRVRVIYFNKSDLAGTVLSISAEENEYLAANEVVITVESR